MPQATMPTLATTDAVGDSRIAKPQAGATIGVCSSVRVAGIP
jgi:hypothetical protein